MLRKWMVLLQWAVLYVPIRGKQVYYPRNHPDCFVGMPKLVEKYGYNVQTHNLKTQDGYHLTTYRINSKNVTKKDKPPVLMMHGLFVNSEDWVLCGPEVSLPYLLADEGYDIWLANQRATKYSRKHDEYDAVLDKEYWFFSWHEIGLYDITANIDYILNNTSFSKLYYIGYSQGSTEFLAMLSEKPEYNNKIQFGVIMAPSVFMQNFNHWFLKGFAKNSKELRTILEGIGRYDLFPPGDIVIGINKQFCAIGFLRPLCVLANYRMFDVTSIDIDAVNMILYKYPDGTSSRSLIHYAQIIDSGIFRQYDYGPEDNKRKYGTIEPPLYNLKNVTVPLAVFYFPNDAIVPSSGVKQLIKELPNVVFDGLIPQEKYGHLDFLHGVNIREIFYGTVLDLLNKN